MTTDGRYGLSGSLPRVLKLVEPPWTRKFSSIVLLATRMILPNIWVLINVVNNSERFKSIRCRCGMFGQ
jgi:hypothetical protein